MASNMKNTKRCLSLFMALVLMAYVVSSNSRQDRHEVLNLLKRLNKHAVKSIKRSDGDIIDCVKLYDQPAFDHPLLNNHTIQLSPTSYPESGHINKTKQFEDEVEISFAQLCKEGTIPIRRTHKSDVLRASSSEAFGKKKRPTILGNELSVGFDDPNLHEYAIAYVRGEKYYGTKATFNVWNPYVEGKNEFSLSQIWLASPKGENTIEVGWHGDGYIKSGCYNLLCSGFVQTSKKIVLGSTLGPISIYGGRRYDITIMVWKGPKTKNWWLKIGKEIVGYWPAILFTNLADSAITVHWGGETINFKPNGKHTLTQMGNGHFPSEGADKASFIRNIKLVDASNVFQDPTHMRSFESKPNCYTVEVFDTITTTWEKHIYFGGPGRSYYCP
ncbi:hypothetical protein ACFE04_011364 [Oxalis oulophora]